MIALSGPVGSGNHAGRPVRREDLPGGWATVFYEVDSNLESQSLRALKRRPVGLSRPVSGRDEPARSTASAFREQISPLRGSASFIGRCAPQRKR